MSQKKTYDPAFKEYVVRLVVLDGKKQTDISKELNIPFYTLTKWVSAYRKQQRKSEKDRQNSLLTASEYKEKYEAEKQRALDLEEENEILKKAMHIFTEEKN
ncbi:transposase [Alkalibacillus haloalkaliphilus]|uniref:transposase n=1 Tax=Alkalibacillus haloalkaliphilus TaxID=94136 RepID=UPI0029356364|nr:transposase [Alkalibacillus haloalkaliphilus]MDV2583508.1 transposase [Alkalibacillus haloalkaliphilus]